MLLFLLTEWGKKKGKKEKRKATDVGMEVWPRCMEDDQEQGLLLWVFGNGDRN